MTAQRVGRLLQKNGVKSKRKGEYKYYFVPPLLGVDMSDLNELDKVLVISAPMFIGTVTGVYHWALN